MTHHNPPGKQLSAPLDEYVRQFEDLGRDAQQLTLGLDDAQFNWSPEPGRWSMAQCFEHLSAVAKPYVEALDEGIAEAKHRGLVAGRPVRYSWFERWLIRSLEPPPRRRLPAPGMFKPEPAADLHSIAEVMAERAVLIGRLGELLQEADAVDVGRAKITSPVTRLLKLRIGAAFAFLASHERRHLWQARQVRQSAEFPGSS